MYLCALTLCCGARTVGVIGVQSWAVFGLNAWAHSVHILHALRYSRGAYAGGKIFMKFRITAAWEGGKVYGFLLGGVNRRFQA